MRIAIRYDDSKTGCDIIDVPDALAKDIGEIAQDFLDWIPPDDVWDDSNGWTLISGQKVISKNTDGLIKWINQFYCADSHKASVVDRETDSMQIDLIVEF